MSKELVKIDEAAIQELDTLSENVPALVGDGKPWQQAFQLAQAMQGLRKVLDRPGVMDHVMALQGSALGFKTDKHYDASEIRDALIEAVMMGVKPIGNQFNIIAGRCYVTKEGFGEKLRKISGLQYQIVPAVPRVTDKGAVIDMKITWTYRGTAGEQTIPFAIRMNAGQGADAITGKAVRKARAWLFATLTGNEVPEGDVNDQGATVMDAQPSVSPFEKPIAALPPTPPPVDEVAEPPHPLAVVPVEKTAPAPAPATPATTPPQPATVAAKPGSNWDTASKEEVNQALSAICDAHRIAVKHLDTFALAVYKTPRWTGISVALRRGFVKDATAFVAAVTAANGGKLNGGPA